MSKNLSEKQRRQELVALLHQYRDGVKMVFLVQYFGVNRATIYRDMKALAEQGTELVRTGLQWKLNFLSSTVQTTFTPYELVALCMAARLLYRQSDEYNPHMIHALQKLSAAINEVSPLASAFILHAAHRSSERAVNPKFLNVFEALSNGWLEQRKVRILYQAYNAETPTVRLCHPYFLEPSSNGGFATYVIAFDETRNAIRTFKLERILDAELLDDSFEPQSSFNPDDIFASAWSIMGGTSGEQIRLRFVPHAVRRIQETFWHPSQIIQMNPDGSCDFTITVAHTLELIPWIRGWGPDVEVLAPLGLRTKFVDEVRHLASLYDSAS